jgi:uncharacterized protein
MGESTMSQLDKKLAALLQLLQELESSVIGFSGGVDSTFLAAAAYRAQGDKAVAITACSDTLPESELKEAEATACHIGIRHLVLTISELDSPDFVENTNQRCYFCKKTRFGALAEWAKNQGIKWVLDGSNADDVSDYRPGLRAIGELGQVRSPLLEVGLTKAEIRELSAAWDLPTWNKLSAACLSSRVAYGLAITSEKLAQIEQAEEFLKPLTTGQVRVRHHGDIARIEVAPQDIAVLALPETAQAISTYFKKLGFTFVTLDLTGYRTGSMNEILPQANSNL